MKIIESKPGTITLRGTALALVFQPGRTEPAIYRSGDIREIPASLDERWLRVLAEALGIEVEE